MISQTAEYALRAVVRLASDHDDALTTQQIAELTRVPAPFLAKVLQGLARGGIVKSRRGLGGGFTLARSPEEITVLDVINAVDPLQRIKTCPLGLSEHAGTLCPLHRRLDEAISLVETAFRDTAISDLVPGRAQGKRSCRFPTVALLAGGEL